MNLIKLRRQIDKLDKDIVSLLNQRAQIAIDVGVAKKSQGKSVYCPDREREILKMINVALQSMRSNWVRCLQVVARQTTLAQNIPASRRSGF